MNNFVCPHCKKSIELTEALMHEFREEYEIKHKKDLEQAVLVAEKRAREEIEEHSAKEMAELQKQLLATKAKNEEFIQKELELRKAAQILEEEKKEFELKLARQLDEERKKLEEKITKDEEERHRLKEKEKDTQIENLKRMLDEAQRKASQASQQIQGEVLEVDLEEQLRSLFPHDEIVPVAKGVRGGDILQKVRNSYGQIAGSILWETKRAKWSPSWLAKLREDARDAGSSIAILVSEEVPKDVHSFGFTDNVLITTYPFAVPLATVLRRNLMQIAIAKTTAANKDEKIEKLYAYLQSDTFRHRFEAYVEGVVEMQEDLMTEKRSAQRLWKKRELQINRALDNVSNMYGELQGIMGRSLPDIKILSLNEGFQNESEEE